MKLGESMPQEMRDRISATKKAQKKTAWNKGKKMPLEQKNRIRNKLRGRTAWNKGKKITETHRQNIIRAKRKKK